MKKTVMALAILLTVNTGTFAQTKPDSTKHHKTNSSKTAKYTCTMHPEIIMDKPGKCPKCGMNLVKVKAKKTA
jgi:hypothetical protein